MVRPPTSGTFYESCEFGIKYSTLISLDLYLTMIYICDAHKILLSS